MIQVKIFGGYNGLEQNINQWLKEIGHKIEIVNILQSGTELSHVCVTIVYKIK